MTRVEEILVENYDKTKDFEILLHIITHQEHFSIEMVKWTKEKIKEWEWLDKQPE